MWQNTLPGAHGDLRLSTNTAGTCKKNNLAVFFLFFSHCFNGSPTLYTPLYSVPSHHQTSPCNPVPNSTFVGLRKQFPDLWAAHRGFGMGDKETLWFGENSCSYGGIRQDQQHNRQHPQHPNTIVITLHCSLASPGQVVGG